MYKKLFVNPVKETETNRKGIVHVVSRLDWYWNLASLLLQENTSDSAGLRTELEKRVVCLYKELLLYQMKSVCAYYRNRGLAFLRTMVQLDDWTGSMSSVNAAEAALRQDSSDYRDQQQLQVLLRLEQLFINANKQETSALDAQPTIKQETKALDAQPKPRPMMVPFGRNKNFIGRKSVLKELLEIIPPSEEEDDCQRVAIEGLGGIGKTQVAIEAAFRVRDRYKDCAVFWVPAIDAASFENAYLEIGRQLGVEGIDDVQGGVDSSGILNPDEDKPDVKLLVKTALSRSTEPWLLIVDNADDPELLFGTDGHVPLYDYLPFNRKGSILFTTRNHEVVAGLDIPPPSTIILGEMSWTEAIDFLQSNLTAAQMNDPEATVKLLSFLAYLPLALKQASAYMAKTKITVTKYLAHCQSSDATLVKLLSKDFEDRGRYKTISNPITTTWLISFNHISRDKPVATKYLKFMSLLAEKNIPQSVLPTEDELEVDEAIATLKAYAFINERSNSEAYDMHRLVRLAMRNWMTQEKELQSCVTGVMEKLRSVYPFPGYSNKGIWMAYLPHALAALEFEDLAADREAEITLIDCVARSCTHTMEYQTAEALYHRAIDLSVKTRGHDSPVTLRLIHNLGAVYFKRGRPEEAETLWREVLEKRVEILGKDHPDTLFSMDNLAVSLQMQGRGTEAGMLIRQVYDLRVEFMGNADPDTLRTTQKLAEIMRREGKHKESEQLSRETLGWMRKIRGVDHPDTLMAMKVLAISIGDQGRVAEAEKLFRELVDLAVPTLGDTHPDTLAAVLCLAVTVRIQRRYEEAETIFRQTIELRKEHFGLENAVTITALRDYAICCERQGKLEQAEELYRQVVDSREKVHHGRSYQTMQAKTDLALFLQEQGRCQEAEEILQTVFDFQVKVFGLEDVRTLETLDWLATVVREQGKLEYATDLFGQLVELQQKVLGDEDPETLKSTYWFASVVREQELSEEAAEIYRGLFPLQKKILGLEDPMTLSTMDDLASCIQQLGMYEEAEGLLQEVFEVMERQLGMKDEETLIALDHLAYCLERQERYEEAEDLFRQSLEWRSNVLGADAPETIISMDNLKDVLIYQGKQKEADALGLEDPTLTTPIVEAAGMVEVPA